MNTKKKLVVFLQIPDSSSASAPAGASSSATQEEEADKKKGKKTKKVNKGRPDEDLFGNTDDIFAGTDVAPKKTTTKKKKKKATATDSAGSAAAPTEATDGGEGTALLSLSIDATNTPVHLKG